MAPGLAVGPSGQGAQEHQDQEEKHAQQGTGHRYEQGQDERPSHVWLCLHGFAPKMSKSKSYNDANS
jgi:hypothetical protein